MQKWLDVGDMAHLYSAGGAKGTQAIGNVWPYIHLGTGFVDGYDDANTLWIAVKDFTDENGEYWAHKIAHGGPVSPGVGQLFPTEFKMVSRFEKPEVIVDGVPSYRLAVDIDEVDPDIKADRMLVNTINSVTGITVERKVLAFSNEYHDNYHIIEYVFTNTGNVDADPEIELKDQTLEGVFLYLARRWGGTRAAQSVHGGGAHYGKSNMLDMVRDGDFRALYSWNAPPAEFDRWDGVGAPAILGGRRGFPDGKADTVGRLVQVGFVGTATVLAEGTPGAGVDDPHQPYTMNWYDADLPVLKKQDDKDRANMAREYDEIIAYGIKQPFHAAVVDPDGDYAHLDGNPTLSASGGHREGAGYGPYTLEPGESVRIVIAEGVDGLSMDASIQIGRAYKRLWQAGDDYADIWYDANGDGVRDAREVMDKNEWVMTGRDSLFKLFRKAIANYESGYSIPQPPKPPRLFRVTSGVDAVKLEWELFAGERPNGFEIYRARDQFQSRIEDNFAYQLIHTAGPEEREYLDTDVQRGVNYFYYIQAVGDETEDPAALGPTRYVLKSNRYYTQTYAPALLKRAPGGALADAQVVPNPYHIGSSEAVRFPGQRERLGFLDIPGQCTIKIFSERGDLIDVIEHTDGSGDAFWDLSTASEQVIVSGLYIAVIEDHETGERVMRKFVIVR